ncbi:hypothetical protein M9Y10_026645 [Tritrichomonas musculus]|uniref:Fungal lipase-like domain-containing protein n=1 Tax=Tritrichomonas musculus TaxID=1915356 RepID=A0ABR2H772_9EUKA
MISQLHEFSLSNHSNKSKNFSKSSRNLHIFSSKKVSAQKLHKWNKKINYSLTRIGINCCNNNLIESNHNIRSTPYSIFSDLISDFENSSNNEKALRQLYNFCDNLSPFMERLRDLLTSIGKFFSFLLIPFFIFSTAYNWCCQKRKAALNRTIRHPLFQAVQKLIEIKLNDEINEITKLKYIYLLSSIDRQKTRETLQQTQFVKLIPIFGNEQKNSEKNEPKFNQYEIFIQNLFTVSQISDSVEDQSETAKNLFKSCEGQEASDLFKKIYNNLTLGEKIDEVGCGREIMHIDESPYKIFGAESFLLNLDSLIIWAFVDKIYEQNDSEEMNNSMEKECDVKNDSNKNCDVKSDSNNNCDVKSDSNKNCDAKNDLNKNCDVKSDSNKNRDVKIDDRKPFIESCEGFTYGKFYFDYDHYISNDYKLYVSVRSASKTTLVTDAKRLGLITPEKAEELKECHINEIQLIYIIFRSLSCIKDVFTAAKNVMDLVPVSIDHADKFTRELIEKIRNFNQKVSSSKIRCIPLFLGFSMGGMTAKVMSIKYGFSSVVFNPLGIGRGLQNFIGEEKLKIARDDNHSLCYQSYFMKWDWVSDSHSNNISKYFIFKPQIGQSFIIDEIPNFIRNLNAMARHNYISYILTIWSFDSIYTRISDFLEKYKTQERLLHLQEVFFNDYEKEKSKCTNEQPLEKGQTSERDKNKSDTDNLESKNQVSNDCSTQVSDQHNEDESFKNLIFDCLKHSLLQSLAQILCYGTMLTTENIKEINSFLIQMLDDQSVGYKKQFLSYFLPMFQDILKNNW